MDTGLRDRVAVVTGGGSGIGKATVEMLVEEGAVVVTGGRHTAAFAALPAAVVTVEVDLSTPEGCELLASTALDRAGRIDVLVNNVGFGVTREGFLQTADADWAATFAINFYSMVRLSRAVLPHMIENGSGSIVNVASEQARQPDVFLVDYAAAKAALVSLSKSLSIEFGPHGIRSNVVSPGPTRTQVWDAPGGFGDWLAHEHGLDREAAIEHFATHVRQLPLGRIGRPEDVAAVIVFLASDLSRQVTGSYYQVDGGVAKAA